MINISAIKRLSSIITRPTLLLPTLQLNSLNDLNIKQLNIDYLIFDKDNTISLTYEDEIFPSIKVKIDEIRIELKDQVAILSNSIGSCDDYQYLGNSYNLYQI